MTIRHARHFLGCSAIVMGLGAIASLWLAFAPVRVEETGLAPSTESLRIAPMPPRLRLQNFANVLDRDLRRPLYDPPPAVPIAARPVPPPPLALQLTGTIIEPGHSRAILIDPAGKVSILPVGGAVAQATVLSIDQQTVQVQYLGRVVTLTVPKVEPR